MDDEEKAHEIGEPERRRGAREYDTWIVANWKFGYAC